MTDVYKYVNHSSTNTITTSNYNIGPKGEVVSYSVIPELDKLDGTLLSKYLNQEARQDPVEFNYYRPILSSEKGDGIRFNIDTPDFGWHDMLSPITIDLGSASNKPTFATFIGNIKKYQFKVGDESFHSYHVLHDYAPNTDMYIHTHWTHNTAVSGGYVKWRFEATYSKGYNQDQFDTPVVIEVTQNASTTPYTHHIAETKLSSSEGAGGKLVSEDIETDGLILVKTSLVENTTGVDPFMMFCDIHYQSTGIPTKNKNFNFWQ